MKRAIVATLATLAILLSACGYSDNYRYVGNDYYDSNVGLTYSYACDRLHVYDACLGLYGRNYYDQGHAGYRRKHVTYRSVAPLYIKQNRSVIDRYKAKVRQKAIVKRAQEAAKKRKEASGGSWFKSSSNSRSSSSSSSRYKSSSYSSRRR